MGRKRRDHMIEPGLYDPEDERAIREGLEEEPKGPEGWFGRWPEDGINSWADLERWVKDNLDEMYALDRTQPRLASLACMIGRQTLQNVTRYLNEHGRGDHPPYPPPEDLVRLDQIEAAMGALLRYLREEPNQEPVTETQELASLGESSDQPELEDTDSDDQKERRLFQRSRSKPIVDRTGFRLIWKERAYAMKDTKEFQILAVLAARFESPVHLRDLKAEVWPDHQVENNTIQRTVTNLRKKLKGFGLSDDLSVDGAIRGHYKLHRPC